MNYDNIKATFDSLIDILGQEVELLHGNRQVRAVNLLPRKEFLQQQYAKCLEYIRSNVKEFTKEQINSLIKSQENIDELAIKSKNALEIMIENNKKIVDEIVKNRASNNNYVSYGRNAKTYGNAGVNISINKKV